MPVICERHSFLMMTNTSYRLVGLASSVAPHPHGEQGDEIMRAAKGIPATKHKNRGFHRAAAGRRVSS
jgi:hypothetical protein